MQPSLSQRASECVCAICVPRRTRDAEERLGKLKVRVGSRERGSGSGGGGSSSSSAGVRIDFVDDGRRISAVVGCLSDARFVRANRRSEAVLVGDVLHDSEDAQRIRVAVSSWLATSVSAGHRWQGRQERRREGGRERRAGIPVSSDTQERPIDRLERASG